MKKEKEKVKSSNKTKIKFLLSPTGKFKLGYAIGDECEIESKQAQELIDAQYAEKVK
tara:strand:- start:3975 stop:4145 length:171 start_codon:yes stop_codon:yes gene_type:complete